MDVVGGDPPELLIAYDGLAGLSLRPILRDVCEQLQRKDPEQLSAFLSNIRRRGYGHVWVAFNDYVSYGIGGGDATAEFELGRYMLQYFRGSAAEPDHLRLIRPNATEHFSLEGIL